MPELPEVECLTRALRSQILGGQVTEIKFLRRDLRDPIPIKALGSVLRGQKIAEVYRRSKYIILRTEVGNGIIHLGMTGNILEKPSVRPEVDHTHVVFSVKKKTGKTIFLHYVDPRRFGRIDCSTEGEISEHKYFRDLGPEPLDIRDLGRHLFERSRKRSTPIKNFLMDAKNVVGVGNIYASEALFRSGIRPTKSATDIDAHEYSRLAKHVRKTLRDAIKAGGTSFRDYKSLAGEQGYFRISLDVYDRKNEPCNKCKSPIVHLVQAGRSSYFCSRCQP